MRQPAVCTQVLEGDLDDRVLEKLSTVTEEGGMVVLTQFEHALSNGSIRNKSAYLNGVIKSHQVANRMQPDLNSRLSDLYKTDKLNGQELDARCMDHLGSLTPQLANRALDAFLSKDLTSARNISALFMSTLRQVCTRDFNPELSHVSACAKRNAYQNEWHAPRLSFEHWKLASR